MSTPLTDDALGARLRTALQDLSPLATDRLPAPRFASTASRERLTPVAGDHTDVVVFAGGGGPRGSRGRRRLLVAGGLLVAAAVAAGAVAVTADLPGRDPVRTPAAGGSPSVVAPTALRTVPDRGGAYLGVTPDPVPWRCTAPAGTTIAAAQDKDQFAPAVWTVAVGVTCAPFPADRGRIAFTDNGNSTSFGDGAVTQGGGGRYCAYIATRTWERDPSFVSRGSTDYLEFAGPNCRLVLPAR